MVKFKILILIFILTSLQVLGQDKEDVSEDVKMLLFSSAEFDALRATNSDFENMIFVLQNHFDNFNYTYSDNLELSMPVHKDGITWNYEIRIYKLPNINSEMQARWLIRYEELGSEIWIRASGYIVNDLKVFFDYLKRHRVCNRKIKQIIKEWCNSSSLFNELNWDCLFDGYRKNNVKADCFKSVFYISQNDSSYGFTPLTGKELNSVFSRTPLYGYFLD